MNNDEQIWFKPYDLNDLIKLSKNTLVEHLQIHFTEINSNAIVATMPVSNITRQPAGLLHGGASVALAETLGSVASWMVINTELFFPVGIEVNANHIRAVKDEYVTGICSPLHIGGRTHVWDIKIYNAKKDLCCVSRLTTSIIAKSKI